MIPSHRSPQDHLQLPGPVGNRVEAGMFTQPGKSAPKGNGLIVLRPVSLYVEPLNPTMQQSLQDGLDFWDIDAIRQDA
jgi:hypothetical protein